LGQGRCWAALARGLSRTRHGAGHFGIGCGLRPWGSVVSFQQTGFGGREGSVAVVVMSAKKQSLINVFQGPSRRSSERCVTLRNSESRMYSKRRKIATTSAAPGLLRSKGERLRRRPCRGSDVTRLGLRRALRRQPLRCDMRLPLAPGRRRRRQTEPERLCGRELRPLRSGSDPFLPATAAAHLRE